MKFTPLWILLGTAALAPFAVAGDWDQAETIARRVTAPHFPDRRISVFGFGARPDGTGDSLPALRAAIAACGREGGGHVVVPAGTYRIAGPIELISNIDLHLEAGAVLRFSGNPADFLPVVTTRWEGVIVRGYSPLIRAQGADNIGVTGPGKIDGNARAGFAEWRNLQADDEQRVFALGGAGAPFAQRTFGAGTYLRPSLLEPYDCTNVLVEGVTFVDSPFWVIHPVFCRNVVVRGATVDSLTINNDGCDPDSCTDVLIEGCRFHTGDDGIAIKAGRDQDAWRDGRATRNVLIRDCLFQSKINALCIGSEMSAGVHDIFMENCRVEEAESCVYFKANRDRGGEISHVRVRNIRIGRARAAVIRFETNYHLYGGGHHSTRFDDFAISDVTCAVADRYAVFIDGNADLPVRGLRLSHVTVDSAERAGFIRNAEDIRFDDVRVNGRLLPIDPPREGPAAQPLSLRP